MGVWVTVVGGTGFIGRGVVARLAAHGEPVRVVSRHLPGAGMLPPGCEHVLGSIEDPTMAEHAIEDARAVLNLVGTTSATRAAAYALHRDAPARLAESARRAGVARFVHVTAMGVAADAPSYADRSKAAGERAVTAAFPGATIVRPALVYGPGDHFFARFAPLVRHSPAIPLIGGGGTRFQPIHVADFAEAVARTLAQPDAPGRVYELGADEVFSFRDLIDQLCAALGRRPLLVPVPFAVAEAGARLTQWLPNPPLTADQVRLLMTDKVIRDPDGAPAALGVHPRPLAAYFAALRANEPRP